MISINKTKCAQQLEEKVSVTLKECCEKEHKKGWG